MMRASDTPSSRTTCEGTAAGKREIFIPLSRPTGQALCDIGEALVVIETEEQRSNRFIAKA